MRQSPPSLQFPYMVYAHGEAFRSSWCLSQSGMPLPDTSFLAAAGAIDAGHPTAEALPEFERRIARLFGVEPERVIGTVGASAAMLVCALRWFRPGSVVASEVPSYEPVRALPEYLGAERRMLHRRLENGWTIEVADVEHALAGSSPGHVFLTNPNNPTGAELDARRLRAIADVAAAHGGVLVSCEVYMEYVRGAERVHAFDVAPNGVSIGSLTKAYGLGGLRAGWIVLGEGLVEERARVRDMTYLGWVDPPTASLRGANLALQRLPELLEPLRRVEQEARPHLLRWLAETPGVHAAVPPHGIIAFARLDGVEDTLAFARWLASEHSVDVVPGEYFGLAGHVRVGCGMPEATLAEGLARLTRGLEAWRAGAGRRT